MPSAVLQPHDSLLTQLHQGTIAPDKLIPLLTKYQLLPQLLRESVIEDAIAPFSCTTEEAEQSRQQFCQRHQLTSDTAQETWLERHAMTPTELSEFATRGLRLEKFKQATWGNKLESYFLKRKGVLDQVIYSLLRTKELGIAQEFYFRIQGGEQSFADLAKTYSQGPEAHTHGLCGPLELGTQPAALGRFLAIAQPGQLSPPMPLGDWIVLVRLEQFIPAQLNEATRQRLLNELFEDWMQKQLAELL